MLPTKIIQFSEIIKSNILYQYMLQICVLPLLLIFNITETSKP